MNVPYFILRSFLFLFVRLLLDASPAPKEELKGMFFIYVYDLRRS